MKWIVVHQFSAYETTFNTFDTEAEATAFYDEWNLEMFHLVHISLSEVKSIAP